MPSDHTELETRLPEPRPFNCKPQVYALYNREVELCAAVASFRVRFGYEPLSTQRTGGGLLLERRPIDANPDAS